MESTFKCETQWFLFRMCQSFETDKHFHSTSHENDHILMGCATGGVVYFGILTFCVGKKEKVEEKHLKSQIGKFKFKSWLQLVLKKRIMLGGEEDSVIVVTNKPIFV